MSNIESEYMDYESAKSNEGGLHLGRSDPTRRLVVIVAIGVGLLVLGGIVLALVP